MASQSSKQPPADDVGGFNPAEIFQLYTGLDVPDPITFCMSKDYLNKPSLYPRQATLLKIIFLRDDLFTDYDREVIAEWDRTYQATGKEGINPGIMERIQWLKANGHRWFKEVLLVLGRRSGKGHISGIAMSYVVWNYLAKGDPQDYYGVDPDKKMTTLIFAGKLKQAIDNLFADLKACIEGSHCFAKYLADSQVAKLSIMTPHDFVKLRRLRAKGIKADKKTVASIVLEARESTTMAGRGTASFCQGYDEMAHVTATTAKASAEDVYVASTPALDQFGTDSFIVEPSSPYQMMGQFYENYRNSILMNEETGQPVYMKMLMLQLPSWNIYTDWEEAHEIPMFPEGYEGDLGEYKDQPRPYFKKLKGAIQSYDDEMKLLERSNPETFAVERRSYFATAQDAYLNPARIAEMFDPWNERDPEMGPAYIVQTFQGRPHIEYKAHGDPSKVNDLFGFALAHKELGPNDRWHVVFDRIHHWDPADFDNHTIDYDKVEDDIWKEFIKPFQPYDLSFDQYASSQTIMRLKRRVREAHLPKGSSMVIHEQTSTRQHNWLRAEVFKAALNMNFIHAPYDEELDLELKFLLKKPNMDVVDHPVAGPVQRKDVADSVMECVYALIGDQMLTMRDELAGALHGGAQGGYEAFPQMSQVQQADIFNGLGRSMSRGVGKIPTYGGHRPRNRMGGR